MSGDTCGEEFGRMGGHLDLEVISDLVSGLLTPEQAASPLGHLAVCDECREMRDTLTEIRHLLETLPAEPMPAGLADRLDRALADQAHPSERADPERADREQSSEEPAGTGRRRTVPTPARWPARWPARAPGWARVAASVVVMGGGAVLGFAVTGGPWPDSHEEPAAGGAPRPDQGLSSKELSEPPAAGSPGHTYTASDLPAKVQSLLRSAEGAKNPGLAAAEDSAPENGAPGGAAPPGSPSAPGGDPPSCVLSATGRPRDRPLVSDTGTYQGEPAVVLVLPHPGDTSRVDVYVVEQGCDTGRGQLIATRQGLPRR